MQEIEHQSVTAMQCLIKLAVALVFTAGAVGCGNTGGTRGKYDADGKDANGTIYETPEACFKAFKAAAAERNMATFYECLTPDSQDLMTCQMVFSARLDAALGSENTKKESLEAILKEYGVDLEPKPSVAGQNPTEALKEVLKDVRDKPTLFSKLVSWMQNADGKSGSVNFDEIISSKLKDVRVDGDSATGTVESTKNGKIETTTFRRVDGGWRIGLSGVRNGKRRGRKSTASPLPHKSS